MSVRPPIAAGAVALTVLLAACAPATRVTLLPQASGQPSAVQVTAKEGTQTLDDAYSEETVFVHRMGAKEGTQTLDGAYLTASVSNAGRVQIGQTTAETVQRRYKALLALQPPPAQNLRLEFETGGAMLTPDSQARLDDVLRQAMARPGGEIVVVGHTDTVGDPAANDALSLQRAEAIRSQLVQRGFPAERVRAEGRGQRQPVVPTGPGVDEPRNRRAEVIIR